MKNEFDIELFKEEVYRFLPYCKLEVDKSFTTEEVIPELWFEECGHYRFIVEMYNRGTKLKRAFSVTLTESNYAFCLEELEARVAQSLINQIERYYLF